jgi:ankyrin repeat protein
MCKLLISSGIPATILDDNYESCFHWACKKGLLNIIKLLHETYNVDINLEDRKNNSPLQMVLVNQGPAQSDKYVECIKYLINKGANIKKRWKGAGFLHLSAILGLTKSFKLLVSGGLAINDRGEQQNTTPLHCALQGSHYSMIKLLLEEYNDNVECLNSKGQTPLQYAVLTGSAKSVQICELLIKNGANVHVKYEGNVSLLNEAVFEQSGKLCELLMNCGIGMDIKDDDGHNPIHAASACGAIKSVQLFINQNKECINWCNTRSESALMIACRLGQIEVVKLLLNNGADRLLKDVRGKTAKECIIPDHQNASKILQLFS